MKTCCVEKCGRTRKPSGRGYCDTHYRVILRGEDPSEYSIRPRNALLAWLEDHKNCFNDECLIWPFGRTAKGYGQIAFRGRKTSAHRVMCWLSHGPPNCEAMQAAHSCGMGHKGCVNPRHLSWKTAKENHQDKVRHGTNPAGERQGSAKFSNKEASAIFRDPRAHQQIADHYGVSRATISRIKAGQTYRDLGETLLRQKAGGVIKCG